MNRFKSCYGTRIRKQKLDYITLGKMRYLCWHDERRPENIDKFVNIGIWFFIMRMLIAVNAGVGQKVPIIKRISLDLVGPLRMNVSHSISFYLLPTIWSDAKTRPCHSPLFIRIVKQLLNYNALTNGAANLLPIIKSIENVNPPPNS